MTRFSRPTSWVGIAIVSLVTAVALAMPSPAAETPTSDPAQAAAGWLARQLVDGERLETVFDGVTYPDQGLTADAILAFDAAGVSQSAATKATTWLATPSVLSGYAGDGVIESYAGSTAKLVLVAEAQGINPTSFGGADLIARLAGLLTPSGRYSDRSAFPSDFSNAIGQSFAVLALTRRPGGPPASAVEFLASSQCPDGGFPVQFAQPTCASSVDATGFAVQAMLAAGKPVEGGKGLDYLVAAQAASGGFADGGTENANSTGLALQALRVGARATDATSVAKATTFLRGLQVGCSGTPAQRGAIAFDNTGFLAGTATRSTPQAILGLSGVGLVDVSSQGAAADIPALVCVQAAPPTTVVPSTTITTTTVAATSTTSTSVPVTVAAGAGASMTTTTRPVIAPATIVAAPLARTGTSIPTLLIVATIALLLGMAATVVGDGKRSAP